MNAKFITHYVSDQAGYPPPPLLPPSLPPDLPLSPQPLPRSRSRTPLVGRPQSTLPPSPVCLFVRAFACARRCDRRHWAAQVTSPPDYASHFSEALIYTPGCYLAR
jgi:hypothetical protein